MSAAPSILDAPAMKRCTKCGVEKPASAFGKWSRNRDGLHPQCRDCFRRYNARAEVRDRKRTYMRVRTYGLTIEQVAALEAIPACLICRKPFGERDRQRHIDHSHESGIVRGAICRGCNCSLGKLEPFLDRVVEYVRSGGLNIKPQEQRA